LNEASRPRLPSTMLWPTYALRVWLNGLLSQTLQAEAQIQYRIDDLEKEVIRLRERLNRVSPVVGTLRESLKQTDAALERTRLTMPLAADVTRLAPPSLPPAPSPKAPRAPSSRIKKPAGNPAAASPPRR
jgi:hypothetical protein